MPDPIDMNPDIAVGVKLPLGNSQRGMFDQSYTTLEQASSNIKNLLLTMKGERPLQPTFGSDLFKSIFEPMVDDGEIEEKCKTAIEEALDEWLPYIHIEELTFTSTDEEKNNNKFKIAMIFSIKSDPKRFDELTFTIQGNTGV